MIAGNGVVTISLFAMLYSPLFWGLGFWWLTAKPGESAATGSEFRLKLLPPPVVGVLLGYLFGITPLHLMLTPAKAPLHFVFEGIRDIASVSIPLANLVLGGMLAAAVKGRLVRWRNVVTVTSVKLVIVPLAALGLLRLLLPWWRHDAALAVAAFVVFVEAISPPATNLAIMSKQSALAASGADVVPGLLLVNYSLALITMPLWLTLFFQLLTH
jgi:predicted permease